MTPGQRKHMRGIAKLTALDHMVSEADIYVRDRSRRFVAARHDLWARLAALGYTYQAIADLGGWDHTSVMAGVMKQRRPPE